ncbi:MAG: hypothetical protein PHY40_02040 [Patescibacteria group bacterium]|nr:hypothetical protein [Patescibacteria group bacterium]
MRKSVLEKIERAEIVEPPLEEITRNYSKYSGFKKGCLTGCASVVIFIIGVFIFLRWAAGPGPQTLKKIPPEFPSSIPVYDPNNVETITFISGKYKNRGIEIAAFFPKIILSPLFFNIEKGNETGEEKKDKNAVASIKNIWKVITTPVGDHRDTIRIEWRDLTTERNFVISYYRYKLQQAGFQIDVESESDIMQQFSFSREDGITGSFFVENENKEKKGTDYAVLTVNISTPAEEKK